MENKEVFYGQLERLAMVLDEIMPNSASLIRDALALLKEQEAVKPQMSISGMWYECPICHRHLLKDRDNYCARCGRRLKWE